MNPPPTCKWLASGRPHFEMGANLDATRVRHAVKAFEIIGELRHQRIPYPLFNPMVTRANTQLLKIGRRFAHECPTDRLRTYLEHLR